MKISEILMSTDNLKNAS